MRTHPLRPPARGGFTLLEIVVVMALLSVILMLIAVTVVGATRIERASADAHLRAAAWQELADRFRADVAGADAAPATRGGRDAGPHALFLQVNGQPVAYRWDAGRLQRSAGPNVDESARQLPLGSDRLSVEFARSGPDGRLITLRLFETRGEGNLVPRLEIAAALGGDLR